MAYWDQFRKHIGEFLSTVSVGVCNWHGCCRIEYMMYSYVLKPDKQKLVIASVFGIEMMEFLVFKGGEIWRIFNNVPTLIGYMSLALLLYSILGRNFKWIGGFRLNCT